MAPAFHARPVDDGRAPGRSGRGGDDTVVPMNGHSVLRTKPVEDVLAQGGDEDDGPGGHAGGHGSTLRRRLGALDLIGFGIGIVIGTGIFTLTGIEAANHAGPGRRHLLRHRRPGRPARRPLLRRAGLRVPTAGSAYTYAYATIGEIFAWIIGWDLLLEFALGAAVVARGWSRLPGRSCSACRPRSFGEGAIVNVGAIVIVLVLRRRRRWSASARVRPGHQRPGASSRSRSALFVIVAGAFFVKAANLTPVHPAGRPRQGAAPRPQAAARAGALRAEPSAFGFVGHRSPPPRWSSSPTPGSRPWPTWARRPASRKRDLPLGLLGTLRDLHGALHRRLAGADRHGPLHRDRPGRADRAARSTRSAPAGPPCWSPSPPSPA